MKIIIVFLLLLGANFLLAKEVQKQEEKKLQTTSERARDMFRKPSSEEEGKIPEKFQPIDHKIKTAPEKDESP